MSTTENSSISYEKQDDASFSSLESQIQQLLDNNEESECFLVEIDPNNHQYPKNWSFWYRSALTVIYGITTFCAQFSSSVMSPVAPQLQREFGVSRVVSQLPSTLFILGIAFGPIIFGPLSEVYGRKVGIMVPFFLSIVFTIATGASKTFSGIIITRFFAGIFAAAPVVSSGGVLSDLWKPSVRGTSLVLYAFFVVMAPNVGSIVGTVIDVNTHWQWTCWITAIISSIVLVIDLIFIKESYLPVLNAQYAKKIRREKRNWLYHAQHEEWELTYKEFFSVHFCRPFAMFATPIVFFVATFASFVFGVFYLFITSVAATFRDVRGWDDMSSSLVYIAIFVGSMFGGVVNILAGIRYRRILRERHLAVCPEERLVPMMLLGWLMPVGIFVFAWTQDNGRHWVLPVFSLVMFGCGLFVIFQNCLNYLVDCFQNYSASAIAANTFLRSIFAGVFPLFGCHLFENLGPNWGGTLLGLIMLSMLPIPFIFYKYGERIREKNPYANLVH